MVHIIFIHLDLGIGGAEQLILQLAQASLAMNNADNSSNHNNNKAKTTSRQQQQQPPVVDLDIVTTRCDAHHCFAAVKPKTGNLHPHLHVYGQWIPASLLGDKGRALMSTIRLLYLAYCVARRQQQHRSSPNRNHRRNGNAKRNGSTRENDDDDDDESDEDDNGDDTDTLIVLDVLPTPLPFLRWTTNAALLFYCHFPDQLLTRSNTSSTAAAVNTTTTTTSRRWYRSVFDQLENRTMQYADTIVVNSHFTKLTVQQTFPFLHNTDQDDLPVLYPALDTSSLDQNNNNNKDIIGDDTDPKLAALLKRRPIVSLNRYERKKNLELLLQAIQWIQQQQQESSSQLQDLIQLPPIIIAGGYDVKNVENVEYRAELQAYCQEHNLTEHVTFLQSISDATRCQLLHGALVVVYTPTNEHFGIVPLEAMYSETPVICVNSGGPVETVVHETTGFLCEPTAEAFGKAIGTLLRDPNRATTMGQAARMHVINKFGQERLHQEWKRLVYDTLQKSTSTSSSRRLTPRQYRLVRCLLYVMEAVVTLGACLCLVYILRRLNLIFEPSETIWKVLRQVIMRKHDETTSPKTQQEL
jgi:alpha-1,3/alpha-1,6-mannosyltransferase